MRNYDSIAERGLHGLCWGKAVGEGLHRPVSLTGVTGGKENRREKARGIKEWSGVQVCNGRNEAGWKKNCKGQVGREGKKNKNGEI